jgi:SAM-dependent methyltransferase
VGVDREVQALNRNAFSRFETTIEVFTRVSGVCGEAEKLPFAEHAFDLVFCQLALMWMPLEQTVAEIGRVTMKGGAVVAIEPDYGGMLEWPEGAGLQEVWIAALTRAGADPFEGRKLPGALVRAGFDVRVETTAGIQPPAQTRFEILRGLPLTSDEQRRVAEVEKRSGVLFSKGDSSAWAVLVHLPFVLVIGTK